MAFRALIAVLLILAIGAVWRFWSPRQAAPVADGGQAASRFYMRHFTLTGYDEAGRQVATLRADRLEQASGSGDSRIEQPRFSLEDADGGLWRLQAQQGEMDAAMTRARLTGGVRVTLDRDPLASLTTPELDVALDERLVRSDAGVVISQGGNRIESPAMSADLSRRMFKLFGGVRGVYFP